MKLVLIRGLPGSGKTTLAHLLRIPNKFEADQFFNGDNGYEFDAKLLPQAHKCCQENTRRCMEAGSSVVVSNTFSQHWEMAPYIELSEEYGAELLVFDLFDNGLTDEDLYHRSEHEVPLSVIAAMRSRWEK